VWRWDQQEPFGDNLAEKNPSGLGAFEFPLRFPGQYFDNETGNSQNGFRDYASYVGRYIESDPIGLRGGLNTYSYVDSDSIRKTDPLGLSSLILPRPFVIPRPGTRSGPFDPSIPLVPEDPGGGGGGPGCKLIDGVFLGPDKDSPGRYLMLCTYQCPGYVTTIVRSEKNPKCIDYIWPPPPPLPGIARAGDSCTP
jgi:RHS repeat-associated protein